MLVPQRYLLLEWTANNQASSKLRSRSLSVELTDIHECPPEASERKGLKKTSKGGAPLVLTAASGVAS
jgi:hypothetical protein